MLYARIRAAHEEALICDFAQYYNIYSFEQVSVATAAILAAGLPTESRTVREMSGIPCTTTELLLASIHDELAIMLWQKSASKKRKPKKPESLVKKRMKKKTEVATFSTAEDFERARAAAGRK